MPIDWQEIIKTLGGQAVWLAAAAWLIKTLVSNRLALDGEKFKIEIKASADTEIERLKNSLQMVALEHQVRFSKLHETRAKVIAELYAQLVDVQYAGYRYVLSGGHAPGNPAQDDEFAKTYAKVNELFFFIEDHQIYLPERICDLLKDFVEAVRTSVNVSRVYGSISYPTPEAREENIRKLMKAAQAFEGHIPAVRKALQDEFRKILGVENSRPPDS